MKKDIIRKGSIINTEIGTIEVTYRNAGGLFAVIEREYDEDGEIENEREAWKTKDELEQAMKTMDGQNHQITWEEDDWEEEDEKMNWSTEEALGAWLSEEPAGADYAADGYTDLEAIKTWLRGTWEDVTEEELESMAEDLKDAVEALQEKEAE